MMRAKLQVRSVTPNGDLRTTGAFETISTSAVTGTAAFGPQGESEDNTFARYTPSASFTVQINNPQLFGKFKIGQKFYVDFTEAPE